MERHIHLINVFLSKAQQLHLQGFDSFNYIKTLLFSMEKIECNDETSLMNNFSF